MIVLVELNRLKYRHNIAGGLRCLYPPMVIYPAPDAYAVDLPTTSPHHFRGYLFNVRKVEIYTRYLETTPASLELRSPPTRNIPS